MKSTPDLCDEFAKDVQVINLAFKQFGRKEAFHGEAVTINLYQDNSKVKEALATNGKGKVLLVDGQGSMERALLGDQLAQLAIDNEWEGIIVNGPIRDCEIIMNMNIGVKALGTHPMKTKKDNKGEINVPVVVAFVEVQPGDYLYADLNGVIVSKKKLI